MPRHTQIKKGSIDLDSVFSPGYILDGDSKIVAGYKWIKFTPNLPANNNDITSFQLNNQPHVAGSLLLVKMIVNGVNVESSHISLNQAQNTIIDYNNTDYTISSDDIVEFWYVSN